MHPDGISAAPTETYLEAESVKLLYQHAWLMSLIVGVTASSLTAYMFSSHVDMRLVAGWLAFFNAVIAVRVALIVLFARLKPTDGFRTWGRCYMILAWINGIAWGLPAFVLDSNELDIVFFYTLVIGGFVAGAIPGLSFNMNAYYGFALFSSLPLFVALFTFPGDFFHLLGVLAVMFLLINTASARISNHRIRQQIRLEFENRRLVEHLKAEKERAERANDVKTRFLAAASHDLRQPLNAMGLFVDALEARTGAGDARRLVDNLKLSTQNLKGLLNSMLDLSRLEAGVLKVDIGDFRLQLLLDQLALEFGAQATEKGLGLRIRPCAKWVRSDPILLVRVLRNLLSNAIQYTPSGVVLLGCRSRPGAVRIEVHDTGRGIPAKELEWIFEEFHQLDNTERDRDKGLGLGLAIVKRIGALLEHEVDVRSVVGKGSTFAITVPTAAAVELPALTAPTWNDDMRGALVVVVDDDAPIRLSMGEILISWGCSTVLADSSEGALALLEEESRAPDLILADYRLRDGKTGVQGVRSIRERFAEDIPAIIVTGDIAPERMREAKDNRCEFLQKPVSAASLRSLASYLIQKAQTGAIAPALPVS